MKDFIGNEIVPGCFCAYPGAGNAKCEYGMILYKVTGIADNKVKVSRIDVNIGQGPQYDAFPKVFTKNAIMSTISIPDHYNQNNGNPIEGKVSVRFIESTIENTNKLAIVHVSEKVSRVFNKILANDTTVFDEISADELMLWVHGGDPKLNPFK